MYSICMTVFHDSTQRVFRQVAIDGNDGRLERSDRLHSLFAELTISFIKHSTERACIKPFECLYNAHIGDSTDQVSFTVKHYIADCGPLSVDPLQTVGPHPKLLCFFHQEASEQIIAYR